MKILHVVQGYLPALGGTERLIQKVSEKLVARHGDEVTVFTTTAYNCELFWRRDQPQLAAGTELINGVTVRRFPVFNRFNEARRLLAGAAYRFKLPYNDWLRAFYNGPLIPGMSTAVARSGAAIVAASSFPLMHMHYALWGGRRAGIPVIFHGGIHTADEFGFNRPMIYRAIHQASAYIANTTYERDYLVEQGVPGDKITVVGVGVDLEPFARADSRILRDRFSWGSAPVIAFVGQQVPHKGIDMLLEALKQLWREERHVCLLIAGAQSTYSPTIKQHLQQLSSEQQQRVAIMENFSEEEKPNIFAACDILAFPSGHESFGIVFLEAWAASKPVIGVNLGAIPTVVHDGVDGLLIEHRNTGALVVALRRLLDNPELGRSLGAQGLRKVKEHYTWDVATEKFRSVYDTYSRQA
jgi:glycosyltransferase involved in cell wall biosynthesis